MCSVYHTHTDTFIIPIHSCKKSLFTACDWTNNWRALWKGGVCTVLYLFESPHPPPPPPLHCGNSVKTHTHSVSVLKDGNPALFRDGQRLIVSLDIWHLTCFAVVSSQIHRVTFRWLLQIINHNNKGTVGTAWFPWDPCQSFMAHRVHKLKRKSTPNPPFRTVERRNRYAMNLFISSRCLATVWISDMPSKRLSMENSVHLIGWDYR